MFNLMCYVFLLLNSAAHSFEYGEHCFILFQIISALASLELFLFNWNVLNDPSPSVIRTFPSLLIDVSRSLLIMASFVRTFRNRILSLSVTSNFIRLVFNDSSFLICFSVFLHCVLVLIWNVLV